MHTVLRLRVLIIVFTAFISLAAYSQPIVQHSLGVSFGGSDFHLKDIHASPLIFRGIGIAPSLQYTYEGTDNRHSIEGQFFTDHLTSESDNFQTDNWRARVRYSYLHRLTNNGNPNRNFEFFLGGSVNSFFNKSNYYYQWFSSQGTSIISWYWSHSVDLAAAVEYRSFAADQGETGGNILSVHCSIPLISNVARPDYSTSGNYNYTENTWEIKAFGKTEVFPHNFSLDALIMYRFPLFSIIQGQLSYEFFYSFYNQPQDMTSYMNNVRAGVVVCF